MVEKVVRDGMVAVLISRSYGAGWSTWVKESNRELVLFHPKLVELVESKRHHEMDCDSFAKWMETELGFVDNFDDYLGGWDGLEILWIPQGTKFKVEEYDGAEYVITENHLNHTA